MRTVFVDTFYFIALVNSRDHAHAKTIEFTARYHGKMLTTAWVPAEFGNYMCSPANRQEFLDTLRDFQADPLVEIVAVDQPQFDIGLQLFADRPDKSWSLTDCISFVVMDLAGITEALTGDHHFEQAGYTALLR